MEITNIGIVCQIVLTLIAIGTLIITIYNFRLSIKSNEKNRKIETSNEMYDLLLKCKRININVNSNLTSFIVKKALWNIVDDIMKKTKPFPNDVNGEPLVYSSKEKPILDDYAPLHLDTKKAYTLLGNYFMNNPRIVSKIRSDQNQVMLFDEQLLLFDICMKSKFSQNIELCELLDKFIYNLKQYEELCFNIVIKKEDKMNLSYLKKLAKIICPEMYETARVTTEPTSSEIIEALEGCQITDENRQTSSNDKNEKISSSDEKNIIQERLNKYIEELMEEHKKELEIAKKSVEKSYKEIESFISPKEKKSLEQSFPPQISE